MLRAKKTSTEYRQSASVVKALNLIWNNPQKSLDLAGIARACNVSKFHFHRIFHEHQGETLKSYITRKRLELVARRLIWYPEQSISKIAMNHGFSSPANFSKSFKNHFGITAKECRHPHLIDSVKEGEVRSRYGKKIDPTSFYSKYMYLDSYKKKKRLKELDNLISVVTLKKQKLLYRTVNDGLNYAACEPIWSEIIEWARNNFSGWEENLFTVWYDPFSVCPLNKIRLDIAIRVPNTFNEYLPFMTQTIDEGNYITGVLIGNTLELVHVNRDIYTFWLAKRGLVPDKTPYYLHYLNDYYRDGFYKVRFYIKLKSRVL